MDAADLIGGARSLALYELLRQRLVREVIVANPAAGAEYLVPVPAGRAWELLSFTATLTTSAVVAMRNVRARIVDPGATVVWEPPAVEDQPASFAYRYTYAAGLGYSSNFVVKGGGFPSPPALMPEGYSLRTLTVAVDAADQWSGAVLVVREWSIAQVVQNLEWMKGRIR